MADKDFKVKGNIDLATPLPAAEGGTGQTSLSNALNAMLPSQAGNNTKVLQTDGTNPTWVTVTQQTATDSAPGNKTYVGTNAPGSPATGDVWIDSSAGSLPTLQRWSKTAAGGETSLSGIDDNNITLTYVVGTEQVYQNGVLLVRNTDYTATNGTSISFTSALVAGDSVNVLSFLGGSVADTYTQAQANSTFYPVATTQIAGKNKIINGDFGIWQRGTSVNLTAATSAFLADRFTCYMDSNAGTATYSQQTFTPGTAPVAGYEGTYFARFSTGGNINCGLFGQTIEDVRTLAGQTVTVSFWMKTSTAKTFTVLLRQNFGTGGSALVDLTNTYTTSTSWQRFSFTFNLGSVAGKTIGTNSNLFLYPVSYSGQTGNFTIDIWGVQLEAGSVATQFTTASGTIQGELALCQRYYYRATSLNNLYENFGFGMTNSSTTGGNMQISFPVTMRTAPTSLDYSTLRVSDFANGYAVTVLTLNGNQNSRWIGNCGFSVASGLTAFRSYSLQSNNSNAGYIGFSAEL